MFLLASFLEKWTTIKFAVNCDLFIYIHYCAKVWVDKNYVFEILLRSPRLYLCDQKYRKKVIL